MVLQQVLVVKLEIEWLVGKAGIPLAGTAVYMTSYSRLKANRPWENHMEERPWLYQSPVDILIKASNGASDFGNKFGQPLISGSVLTFEHEHAGKKYGYDKVIMQAGGIGYGVAEQSKKDVPQKGDKIVVMGGDNYRIGMGGSAVSSVDTGSFANQIELNAVQRANPEMQKKSSQCYPCHGGIIGKPNHFHSRSRCWWTSELSFRISGRHWWKNRFTENFQIGDTTLSAKEIVGNESQERMGLVIKEKDIAKLEKVSQRERAPFYVVGEITGDHHFSIVDKESDKNPVDWPLASMFGSAPKTILADQKQNTTFTTLQYEAKEIEG